MSATLVRDSSGEFTIPVLANGTSIEMAVSSVVANSAALSVGIYRISCSSTTFFKIGVAAVIAAANGNSGARLWAEQYWDISIREGERISAICASGVSGTLYATKLV